MSEMSHPSNDTSSGLLVRARTKDPEAWLQLVRWIGPFVLRWCHGAGLQGSDCDDVSQQVVLNLWNNLGTFRKDRPGDTFRGWVYVITRNCLRDFVARRRTQPGALPLADIPAEPADDESRELTEGALQLILDGYLAVWRTDTGFQAFYRAAVDGLPAPEVAGELGISAAAVRQHKSRWIKRLREQLAAQFGELLG